MSAVKNLPVSAGTLDHVWLCQDSKGIRSKAKQNMQRGLTQIIFEAHAPNIASVGSPVIAENHIILQRPVALSVPKYIGVQQNKDHRQNQHQQKNTPRLLKLPFLLQGAVSHKPLTNI